MGRSNLPIRIGRKASSLVYGAFLLLAFLSIVLGVVLDLSPATALIGLLALGVAVPAFVGAYRFADDVGKLVPYLGLNVITNIVTPVLVAVGLFIGLGRTKAMLC